MIIETVNRSVALLTIAAHAFLVLGIVALVFSKKSLENILYAWLGRYGMHIAFLVALGSMAMSLFYSEYAGFEPCVLCWYQRIALYPQVVLLGMALWKRETRIVDYALALAGIGLLIALYHNYIYFGGASLFSCTAFGLGASCTRRYVFEFGYITIPLMALTGFLLLIFFLFLAKMREKMMHTHASSDTSGRTE